MKKCCGKEFAFYSTSKEKQPDGWKRGKDTKMKRRSEKWKIDGAVTQGTWGRIDERGQVLARLTDCLFFVFFGKKRNWTSLVPVPVKTAKSDFRLYRKGVRTSAESYQFILNRKK